MHIKSVCAVCDLTDYRRSVSFCGCFFVASNFIEKHINIVEITIRDFALNNFNEGFE